MSPASSVTGRGVEPQARVPVHAQRQRVTERERNAARVGFERGARHHLAGGEHHGATRAALRQRAARRATMTRATSLRRHRACRPECQQRHRQRSPRRSPVPGIIFSQRRGARAEPLSQHRLPGLVRGQTRALHARSRRHLAFAGEFHQLFDGPFGARSFMVSGLPAAPPLSSENASRNASRARVSRDSVALGVRPESGARSRRRSSRARISIRGCRRTAPVDSRARRGWIRAPARGWWRAADRPAPLASSDSSARGSAGSSSASAGARVQRGSRCQRALISRRQIVHSQVMQRRLAAITAQALEGTA